MSPCQKRGLFQLSHILLQWSPMWSAWLMVFRVTDVRVPDIKLLPLAPAPSRLPWNPGAQNHLPLLGSHRSQTVRAAPLPVEK